MLLISLVRRVVRWIIGKPWILIIIGVGLLIVAPTYDGKRPPCGDDDLLPGQLCEYEDGTVTTYEQEAADDRQNIWFLGGLGLVSLGAGIYGVIRNRRAAKQAAVPKVDARFPAQPGIPPAAGPGGPFGGAAAPPPPNTQPNSPFNIPPGAPPPGHGAPPSPGPETDPPPPETNQF